MDSSKLTKMVYHIHLDDVIKRTEKAFLVQIEDRSYWIPKSTCKLQSATNSKGRKLYRLLLPAWYTGDILAKAHNGDYINNVSVYSRDEIFKGA